MRRRRAVGFTLVEAVTAMLVAGILVVSAMRAVGSVGLQRMKTAEQAVGNSLADGMMTQILRLAYQEPNGTPNFGTESGESTANKSNYDDVDDFNGWSESPPRDVDNSVMTDMAGWTRSVQVDWVLAATPTTVSSSETGVKRITVTVTHNGRLVTQRVALRSNAP